MEYALMPAPSTYGSKPKKNWIDHILIRISNSERKMGTRILSFSTRLSTLRDLMDTTCDRFQLMKKA
jgi:hypothetical protein